MYPVGFEIVDQKYDHTYRPGEGISPENDVYPGDEPNDHGYVGDPK